MAETLEKTLEKTKALMAQAEAGSKKRQRAAIILTEYYRNIIENVTGQPNTIH